MILDAAHRAWIVTTLALTLLAAAVYLYAGQTTPGGVSGGRGAGLVFGILAAAVMAVEGLLALKRRRPAWRVGRASTWLRGHIWFGLLAVPLVLFHADFRTGGTVSLLLLAVFGFVTLSGLFGLLMQQFLPRMMTTQVEMETIYEQIPHVVSQLREEATQRVEKTGETQLTRFLEEEVDPFLASDGRRGRLSDRGRAEAVFAQLRALVPVEHHETLGDLAHICEERRQLALQTRLHHWLHGWVLVHVPLSYALLLMVAAHAVIMLAY